MAKTGEMERENSLHLGHLIRIPTWWKLAELNFHVLLLFLILFVLVFCGCGNCTGWKVCWGGWGIYVILFLNSCVSRSRRWLSAEIIGRGRGFRRGILLLLLECSLEWILELFHLLDQQRPHETTNTVSHGKDTFRTVRKHKGGAE